MFWIYRAFADKKASPLGKSEKLVERGLHSKLIAPASSEVNSYSMFTCVNCCFLFLFIVVAFYRCYHSRVQILVLDKTMLYIDSIAYHFIFTNVLLYIKQHQASNTAKECFSPSKVKRWAVDDLSRTITWLESQDEKVCGILLLLSLSLTLNPFTCICILV